MNERDSCCTCNLTFLLVNLSYLFIFVHQGVVVVVFLLVLLLVSVCNVSP